MYSTVLISAQVKGWIQWKRCTLTTKAKFLQVCMVYLLLVVWTELMAELDKLLQSVCVTTKHRALNFIPQTSGFLVVRVCRRKRVYSYCASKNSVSVGDHHSFTRTSGLEAVLMHPHFQCEGSIICQVTALYEAGVGLESDNLLTSSWDFATEEAWSLWSSDLDYSPTHRKDRCHAFLWKHLLGLASCKILYLVVLA